MRLILIILVILLIASAGWYFNASKQKTTREARAVPELIIDTTTLENGLEVVVVPSTRVPAISHILWVKAGAIDEAKGASGVAHYLEHLLFKGTPTTPAGEYSKTIVSLGGNHNAFTGHDFTGYYVNIAKEHIETVMALEADRIANVAPSDIDYEKERNVILEERKTRVDSNPNALFAEQLAAQLFVHHPYGTPIIGWRHEMERLGKKEATEYLAQHYTPDNMVLVLAGDITLEEALPLAQKYYGGLQGKAKARRLLQEPPQRGAKFFRMEHPQVRQSQWSRITQTPSLTYGDTARALPLMLLAEWLGGDRSSVLYNKLVVEQKLASYVSVGYNALRLGPGTLSIHAIPAENVSLEQLQEAVQAALQTLATTQISDADLQPYKTQLNASTIFARDSLQGLGQFAGYMRMLNLEDGLITRWADIIDAISAADVQAVMPYLLQSEGSITGHLVAAAEAPDA